jgi:hypothetical protein
MTFAFTFSEVSRGPKKRNSPGKDEMTNEMLKHMGQTAKVKLLRILNVIWKTVKVPQETALYLNSCYSDFKVLRDPFEYATFDANS